MGHDRIHTFNTQQQQQQQNPFDQFGGVMNVQSSSIAAERKVKTTGPIHNARYKLKMCGNFEREGKCPYNEKCQFAHGQEELERWTERRRILDQREREKQQQMMAMQQQMAQANFGGYNASSRTFTNESLPPMMYRQRGDSESSSISSVMSPPTRPMSSSVVAPPPGFEQFTPSKSNSWQPSVYHQFASPSAASASASADGGITTDFADRLYAALSHDMFSKPSASQNGHRFDQGHYRT